MFGSEARRRKMVFFDGDILDRKTVVNASSKDAW